MRLELYWDNYKYFGASKLRAFHYVKKMGRCVYKKNHHIYSDVNVSSFNFNYVLIYSDSDRQIICQRAAYTPCAYWIKFNSIFKLLYFPKNEVDETSSEE